MAVSNPANIHVVTPSWLFSTLETKKRAPETEHGVQLDALHHRNSSTNHVARKDTSTKLEKLLREPPNDDGRHSLFESHQFYLLGFEDHDRILKQNLGKLIRRGKGTLYWDLNEDITLIVLRDDCDEALYKAAQVVSSHHTNLPPVVSPLWVLDSYGNNRLQLTRKYPPNRTSILHGKNQLQNVRPSASSATSSFSVFRGCLFAMVRTTPSDRDEFVMDFDPNEQEAFIKAHGGQILSNNLLEALRADAKICTDISSAGDDEGLTPRLTSTRRRKCHVVCWGGPPRLETNPLVSQLKRNDLCDLVLVSPIWVQTCVSVKKRVRPERVPFAFMPQTWPMKSINPKQSKGDQRHLTAIPLHVSLTGFQGTEKMAAIHLIGALGGLYHDNMSDKNTHLICKEKATGLKLEKAIQWGLHVVSIKWLYHVLQHGYGGIHGDKAGCEARFLGT